MIKRRKAALEMLGFVLRLFRRQVLLRRELRAVNNVGRFLSGTSGQVMEPGTTIIAILSAKDF